MSAVQAPRLEDVDAILHGFAEAGTVRYIADGVATVARSTLTGPALARALARLREVTGSAEFAQELACDVLARCGPLDRADHETLTRAMCDASEATIYALGVELVAAVGGA